MPKISGSQPTLEEVNLENPYRMSSRTIRQSPNALKAIAGQTWYTDTVTLRTFYLSYIRAKIMNCSEVMVGYNNQSQ